MEENQQNTEEVVSAEEQTTVKENPEAESSDRQEPEKADKKKKGGKKKALIWIIVAVSICAIAGAIVLAYFFAIRPAQIRKTGGLVNGEIITESTDPDDIISQKVSESTWNDVVKYFNGTEQAQSLIKVGDTSIDALTGLSVKLDITLSGNPYMAVKMKLEGDKVYMDANGTEVYVYENKNTSGDSDFYLYQKSGEEWKSNKVSQAIAKQATDMSTQVREDMDWSFGNFKYDNKKNSYVGKLSTMGITFDVELKIVNNLPCYMKLSTKAEGQTMVSTAFYYDVNNTEVELPNSDGLSFEVNNGTVKAVIDTRKAKSIIVPSTYKGYPVEIIRTIKPYHYSMNNDRVDDDDILESVIVL